MGKWWCSQHDINDTPSFPCWTPKSPSYEWFRVPAFATRHLVFFILLHHLNARLLLKCNLYVYWISQLYVCHVCLKRKFHLGFLVWLNIFTSSWVTSILNTYLQMCFKYIMYSDEQSFNWMCKCCILKCDGNDYGSVEYTSIKILSFVVCGIFGEEK